MVKDLWGLARMALPKDINRSFVPISASGQQTEELQSRTRVLAERAKIVVDLLLGIEKTKFQNKNMGLVQQLSNYRDSTQKIEYLMTNPLDLWGFSMIMYNQKFELDADGHLLDLHYDKEFEFDVRGDIHLTQLPDRMVVQYRIGEAKAGHDFGKAIRQLLKRLSILSLAGDALVDQHSMQVSFALLGDIYSFLCWKRELDNLDVEKELDKLQIRKREQININVESL